MARGRPSMRAVQLSAARDRFNAGVVRLGTWQDKLSFLRRSRAWQQSVRLPHARPFASNNTHPLASNNTHPHIMTRLYVSLGLALACLSTAATAANSIWAAFTGSCQQCLDQAFVSCPGDYKTVSYAKCMCAGAGGANVNTCLGYCNAGFNEPTNVVNSYYMYCAIFFAKDVCPAAAKVFDQQTMDRLCSPEAVAKSGSVSDADGSGSGSGAGSGSGSGTGQSAGSGTGASSGSGSGASVPGVAADSTGNAGGAKPTGIGANAGATSTSKALAATALPLPGLGVMAGLGVALVNMNL
ncbi:hypothetical protein MAPG_05895 [Magnaporthiopsis poae ATCC 64411]|uniref:Uncharacterized protein n=1 Tax=Magnaporthiopsis poae (strain ATCC 64411 / 73-15) TaxID=644358 RepID=A0A0C4E0L5_MAGP6|nr:hypothetical protein MAPG_05895 [Magnaporthiopsis poae ATCC 64411]